MKNILSSARVSILFLSLILASCLGMKELEYTGVKGFKINSINTQGINGDIMVSIRNPNPYGFSIHKSEFDVSYNGVFLGKARLDRKVRIKAKAEETYAFNLKSDFSNVDLADVIKLLNGASNKGMLEVKGDLKAGKMLIRKKFPVNIKEKLSLE